jgi:hypothetical protein
MANTVAMSILEQLAFLVEVPDTFVRALADFEDRTSDTAIADTLAVEYSKCLKTDSKRPARRLKRIANSKWNFFSCFFSDLLRRRHSVVVAACPQRYHSLEMLLDTSSPSKKDYPFPTAEQRCQLARESGLSEKQVSDFAGNWRKRKWKRGE